jgi:hypothetical protein
MTTAKHISGVAVRLSFAIPAVKTRQWRARQKLRASLNNRRHFGCGIALADDRPETASSEIDRWTEPRWDELTHNKRTENEDTQYAAADGTPGHDRHAG